MRIVALCGVLLLLAACSVSSAQKGWNTTKTSTRDNYVLTKNSVREFFSVAPKEKPKPKAVSNAYCYKVQLDIVCYSYPIEGADDRMVGFQEQTAGAAFSGSAAPAPQNMSYSAAAPVDRVYVDAPRAPVSVSPMPTLGGGNYSSPPPLASSSPQPQAALAPLPEVVVGEEASKPRALIEGIR